MPFGEYPYTMDDKGRVVIPQVFRDFVEDGMVLTRGLEGCLSIFPSAEWKRIEDALLELPLNDPNARAWTRFMYSGAVKVRLDPQFRISIPGTLRQFAALEADVMVVGFPKRLEIWNHDKWIALIADIQDRPPMQELLPDPLKGLPG